MSFNEEEKQIGEVEEGIIENTECKELGSSSEYNNSEISGDKNNADNELIKDEENSQVNEENRSILESKLIEKTIKIIKNKWVIAIVAVFAIILTTYNFSEAKAYKQINKYSTDLKLYNNERDKVESYISRILKKDTSENFKQLLDIVLKSNNELLGEKVVYILTNKYKKTIDYTHVMEKVWDNNTKNLNLVLAILESNSKEDNEQIFIKNNETLINTNNSRFISKYKLYANKSIGYVDNIHKLKIDINDLSLYYLQDEIDDDVYNSFIENRENDEVLQAIINLSKEEAKQNNYKNSEKLINKINEFELIINEPLLEPYNNLVKLVELIKAKESLVNEKNQLEEKYNNNSLIKEEKNKELEIAIGKKEKAQSEISNLDKEMEKYKPFTISGYIIGKTRDINSDDFGKGEEYEVKYTSDIPYGNKNEVDRFILETYDTMYTSKGNFSLDVVYNGSKQVTVKEDFGGFTQTWKVYSEFSAATKTMYEAALNIVQEQKSYLQADINKVDTINNEIKELDEFIKNYDSIMNEKNQEIQEVEKNIEELKNSI